MVKLRTILARVLGKLRAVRRRVAAKAMPREDADRWASGSKLPGVYWHGSRVSDIEELESGAASYKYGGSIGPGIYVAPTREGGEFYAKEHLFEVRVNVKNPLSLDDNSGTTSSEYELGRLLDELQEAGSADNTEFLDWLADDDDREVEAIEKLAAVYAPNTDEATLDSWRVDSAPLAALMLGKLGYSVSAPTDASLPKADFGQALELAFAMDEATVATALMPLLERYAKVEVEAMEIPDSVLVGESVPPFYLNMGSVKYTVGFKREGYLELELGDIGPEAEAAGYDAVAWLDRYPHGEVLVFDPANVAIVSESLPKKAAVKRYQSKDNQSLREELAALEHERWSHWMAYVFGLSTENADGTVTIPADQVERWQRKVDTPYGDLSDEEQESDRKEIDKFLKLIHKQPELKKATAGRRMAMPKSVSVRQAVIVYNVCVTSGPPGDAEHEFYAYEELHNLDADTWLEGKDWLERAVSLLRECKAERDAEYWEGMSYFVPDSEATAMAKNLDLPSNQEVKDVHIELRGLSDAEQRQVYALVAGQEPDAGRPVGSAQIGSRLAAVRKRLAQAVSYGSDFLTPGYLRDMAEVTGVPQSQLGTKLRTTEGGLSLEALNAAGFSQEESDLIMAFLRATKRV